MASHSNILAKTLGCSIKSEDLKKLNLCFFWEGPGSQQPCVNFWWGENDGPLGAVAPITAGPSALPCTLSSPAGCGGALTWSKHKNIESGSQTVSVAKPLMAPGWFVAQILSSWVREAKVQRRAASTIRNMFWAWGLEELKIGTCGPNYRTKRKVARKRNNLGKLGTVDQPEYCKQRQILLLLSSQERSESCNRWSTLCMRIKCMVGRGLKKWDMHLTRWSLHGKNKS